MPSRGIHRFAVLTASATLVLIFIGGLVTSTGSGLAVPDWPLSYGQLMPPMVGGVFYEHGHRMAAATVGLMTTVLAVWIFLREKRRFIGWLAATALAAVIAQGMLGGLTVLLLLPPAVSVLHACLAQAFFCLTVALAVVTGPEWADDAAPHAPGNLRGIAAAATGAIYVQLILGAVMRHTGAGLAIPDFPLALGRIVPPLADPKVAIHFAHRLWALAVAGIVAAAVARALKSPGAGARLRVPAILMAVLAAVQIALGALTVLTAKAVVPTTSHVATGAALLGVSLWLTLRSWRPGARAARGGAGAARTAPAAGRHAQEGAA